MREFDPLSHYPEPKNPRIVGTRTMQNRLIACERGKEFYDGARDNGFGGYHYDGRWLAIAQAMSDAYSLAKDARILQIGCDKGFLLHDFLELCPSMEVTGLEVSPYPIETAMLSVKPFIQRGSFTSLPFADGSFDLVIAMGAVYTLNLPEALTCLREIGRVTKSTGNSFITLASYEGEQDFWLFRDWSLLGTLLLPADDWREVLRHSGYRGDYKLTSARSLKLQR